MKAKETRLARTGLLFALLLAAVLNTARADVKNVRIGVNGAT